MLYLKLMCKGFSFYGEEWPLRYILLLGLLMIEPWEVVKHAAFNGDLWSFWVTSRRCHIVIYQTLWPSQSKGRSLCQELSLTCI